MNIKKIVKSFPKHKIFVDLNFSSFSTLVGKADSEENFVVPDNALFAGFLDMFKCAEREEITKSEGVGSGFLGMLFKGKLPEVEDGQLGIIYDILQKTEICSVDSVEYDKDAETFVWMGEVTGVDNMLSVVDSVGGANYAFTSKQSGDLAEYIAENRDGLHVYKDEKTLIVSSTEMADFKEWDGMIPITKIKFKEGEELKGFAIELRKLLDNAATEGELSGWNPTEEEYEPYIWIRKVEPGRVIYTLRGNHYSLGWKELPEGGHKLVFPEVEVKAVHEYVEVTKSLNVSQRILAKISSEIVTKVRFQPGDESIDNLVVILTKEAYALMESFKFGQYIPLDYDWNQNVAPVYFMTMDSSAVLWEVPWGTYKTEWTRKGAGEYTLGDPVQVRMVVNFVPVDDDAAAVDETVVSMSHEPSYSYKMLNKADDEERYVFGIVLEPLSGVGDDVDLHEDYYTKETIKDGMTTWMMSRHGNSIQHKKWAGNKITVIENYLAPVDFEYGDETIKKGTWLLGAKINDDALWKEIKKDNFTGWSIGAFGLKIPDDDSGTTE